MIKKYGFILHRQEKVEEINSEAFVFEHEKTKARLIYLKNDDNNKAFAIGFRTPPNDDTGVPHIVEHCVLSGSRKYKTKEPFMDLYKSSMQTFLNAMTYPDKTIYPIASRNEKDFENLTDVYLDSVFFPMMHEEKMIFNQEAWHHELFDKNDPIKYVGVVYNEMRGAYSSPDSLLYKYVQKSIFPDSIYNNDSGGDPYAIPNLTYENFKAFHKKYYHPSNSYIFIYGDTDIDKHLEHIDSEYLSKFDYLKVDSEIEGQKPFNERKEKTEYYSVSEEDEIEGKDYFAMTYSFGEAGNVEDYYMVPLLSEMLINSEAAPIKNAILEKELGEDVFIMSDRFEKAIFSIIVKNADHADKQLFLDTLEETFRDIVENGLDKKLVEASLNKLEFKLRETGDSTIQGILRYIQMMDAWLYDKDPIKNLKYEEVIKSLREKAKTDFFEKYIEKNFLNNKFSAFLNLRPERNLFLKKDKELEEKLAKFKESLSDKEIDELISANKALEKMQLTDDSKEKKATIPRLALSDINKDSGIVDYEVLDGNTVYREAFTSGVVYFKQCYDISHLSVEELQYAMLLSELLGYVDTEKYDYKELSNEMFLKTGGIGYDISVTEHMRTGDITIYLTVTSKVLREKINKAYPLIEEISLKSKFDSMKRLKEIIQMLKSRMEMGIISDGNSFTQLRVKSYFSKLSRFRELLDGLESFDFLQKIEKNFDSVYDELVEKLNSVYKKMFQSANAVNMVVCEKGDYEKIISDMKGFLDKLPVGETKSAPDIKIEVLNEGIKSSANVQYVSKGANLKELGYEVTGTDAVVSRLLNMDYLHNNIRAKGGAYGAGIGVSLNGDMSTYSYRDPNLVETLNVYDNIFEYLENIEIEKDELDSIIIATMNGLDPVLSERGKGEVALSRYLQGLTDEEILKQNREVLSTTVEDIRARADIYKKAMSENMIAVLGSEQKIEENKGVFKNIKNLILK